MNSTVSTFKEQNERLVAMLRSLSVFLDTGEALGVSVDASTRSKLDAAIHSVSGSRLRVALVGGFSEGKTSIAAAWMEQLDRSSMKISHRESSDSVVTYQIGTDIELVDTPGLFGFRERVNPTTQELERYKDITRKYVSEAHVVLYVMNPSNPVKESHQEDLVWLFRTLALLPRTVFVLGKFDQVADVEDPDAVQRNLEVKRANVAGRLRDVLGLTSDEEATLSIVGVSADPFEMGVDHWLANLDRFKALSNIGSLQAATSELVVRSGGHREMALDMQKSVISDVLHKEMPIAIRNQEQMELEVDRLDAASRTLGKQLETTSRDIEAARRGLREFVIDHFTGLITRVQGCTIETIGEFYENEIGDEGIVLTTRLENRFGEEMESATLQLQKMDATLSAEANHFNETARKLGKQGIRHVLGGNFINNTSVLAARDGVVAAGKYVGLDLAKTLRFKPWGAIKFANAAKGALAAAGLAIELWDSWNEYEREQKFRAGRQLMVDHLTAQRKELIEKTLEQTGFAARFFPSYVDLESRVKEIRQQLDDSRTLQARFQEWRLQAEAIDVEFQRLAG